MILETRPVAARLHYTDFEGASMRRICLVATLFAASNAFGQTTAKESDILPSLLEEMRRLRVAIESMTVASWRAGRALLLQLQDAAVARSAQRLDTAKGKCADLGRLARQHSRKFNASTQPSLQRR